MYKSQKPFSSQLESWLKSSGSKTVKDLTDVFGEKSFAIVILILMFFPALPLPTGGITHVFEVITMLLALEMVVGRRTIWLPKRWQSKQLGGKSQEKMIPFIARRIRWFEKYSKPRLGDILKKQYFLTLCGLIIFSFALASALALPFTGLDTLPAMGAVAVALSLILEDIGVFIVGCLIGSLGIFIEIFLAATLKSFIVGIIK